MYFSAKANIKLYYREQFAIMECDLAEFIEHFAKMEYILF